MTKFAVLSQKLIGWLMFDYCYDLQSMIEEMRKTPANSTTASPKNEMTTPRLNQDEGYKMEEEQVLSHEAFTVFEEKLSDLHEENLRLKQRVVELDIENKEQRAKLAFFKESRSTMEGELKRVNQELDEEKRKAQEVKYNYSKVQSSFTKLTSSHTHNSARLRSKRKQVVTLKRKVERLEMIIKDQEEENNQRRRKLEMEEEEEEEKRKKQDHYFNQPSHFAPPPSSSSAPYPHISSPNNHPPPSNFHPQPFFSYYPPSYPFPTSVPMDPSMLSMNPQYQMFSSPYHQSQQQQQQQQPPPTMADSIERHMIPTKPTSPPPKRNRNLEVGVESKEKEEEAEVKSEGKELSFQEEKEDSLKQGKIEGQKMEINANYNEDHHKAAVKTQKVVRGHQARKKMKKKKRKKQEDLLHRHWNP